MQQKLQADGYNYDGVANKLYHQGVEFTRKQAEQALTKYGYSMSVLQTAYKSSLNTNSIEEWSGNYFMSKVESPHFARHLPWNKADHFFFDAFRYTQQSDGTALILITGDDNHIHPVYTGCPPRVLEMSLAAVCSQVKYQDTNLLDHLNKSFSQMLEVATGKAKKLLDVDEFAKWCTENLPVTMLQNAGLVVMWSKVTIPNRKSDGKYPEAVILGSCDMTPIKFLANNLEVILANHELNMLKPPVVYTNNPDVPALNYINLDAICEDGPCPTWDHYMLRYTPDEQEVFKAFIWSIFDAENTGRQMLYIYDKNGFAAKTVLTNCLSECLGENLVFALQKGSLDSNFGFAKIWDKRLVIYDDNKNTNLVRYERMHILLGGGRAEIEYKGRNSFTAKLQAKVIANGNVPLTIDTKAMHERTRVITISPVLTNEMLKEFCLVDANGELVKDSSGCYQFLGDNTFAVNLKHEFKRFLSKCRDSYAVLCPNRTNIILPESLVENIEEMSSDESDLYDSIMPNYLIGEQYECTPKALMESAHTYLNEMGKYSACNYTDFKVYLTKRYNIRKKSRRVKCNDGTYRVEKVYTGIAVADKLFEQAHCDDATQDFAPLGNKNLPFV